MELYPVDIVIHIVNIVVLYVILRLLLYKPVRRFMLARSERVQKQLDDADETRLTAGQIKAEYEQKIQNAQDEAKQIVMEASTNAIIEAEAIVNESKERAAQIIRSARERADFESEHANEQLRKDIIDAAVGMAGLILKREVSAKDNSAIVDEFFGTVAKISTGSDQDA